MGYLEYLFLIEENQELRDVLVARLMNFGFESFVDDEKGLKAYLSQTEVSESEDPLSDDLRSLNIKYSVEYIEDQNWNAIWESDYQPVVIANRCHIRAPFHSRIDDMDFDIIIEPKMSFGTAHHETTHMMLEFILEMNVEGKSVVDIGCGTGVLAILANMKGASSVIAIDNDSWAYENAKDNVKANNAKSIEVILGDLQALDNVHADIIIANINKNILLNDIPGYANSLSDEGELLLSGFYQTDLKEIEAMCKKKGLVFVSERTMNDWTAAMFKLKAT